MRPPFFILLALFAMTILMHCESTHQRASVHSFYFWKTSMEMDSAAWATMNRFGGDPLYVRFFDVDFSAGYGEAIPLGQMNPSGSFDGRSIVPTVFLTNRVFERLEEKALDTLAGKVVRKMFSQMDGFADLAIWKQYDYVEQRSVFDSLKQTWLSAKIHEIQIDCDWTNSTKDKYFYFLKSIRKRIQGKTLSCTVRLHQYRDRDKSGIPPVDRAMLMCYNMASPKHIDTPNAILDPSLVKGYLKASAYPLPLDIALPFFSWAAWFRDGQFKGLMSAWDKETMSNATLFTALGNHRFRLLRDTVIGADYLREGDLFRLDEADSSALLQTTDLLRPLARDDARIVIFDWDTRKIQRHESLLKDCFARF